MDEVGRGTTVVDGLAIAYATIHHLVSRNQCRTLFATHFHELSDMVGYPHSKSDGGIFNSVDFFCTDVVETDVSRLRRYYDLGLNRDLRMIASPINTGYAQGSIGIVMA